MDNFGQTPLPPEPYTLKGIIRPRKMVRSWVPAELPLLGVLMKGIFLVLTFPVRFYILRWLPQVWGNSSKP